MNDKLAVTFGKCRYSVAAKDVLQSDGSSAGMRRQTVEVFRYLTENQHRVVTREEIIANVWGDRIVSDDSIYRCISEISQALQNLNRCSNMPVLLIHSEGDLMVPLEDGEYPASLIADCSFKVTEGDNHTMVPGTPGFYQCLEAIENFLVQNAYRLGV